MTSDVGAARLQASWTAVGYLALHGSGVSVRELAAAAGLSERTFYRYFPTREDILRPAMRDSQNDIARAVDAEPADSSLGDALVAGFAAAAEGAYTERTRHLLPVVFGSAPFSAVWSQELRQHGPMLRAAVARRLDCDPDDVRAEVAAALFLSLMELALAAMIRTGELPAPLLADRMRAVGSDLFDHVSVSTGT